MSNTPMKTAVLDLLRLARAEEQDLLAGLSEAERAATGTPERWSAKDTVAHIAAWRRRHAEKIALAVRGEPVPRWTDEQVINQLNAQTYPLFQHRPWHEVQAEVEGAYAALVTAVASRSEAELTDPQRYPTMNGEALWPETLGNGVWHPFTHLLAFAQERADAERLASLGRARVQAYEALLGALEQAGESPRTRAYTMYNLTCVYALAGQPERALARLEETLRLRPELAGHALHDDDFVSLREDLTFQALTAKGRESQLIGAQVVYEQRDSATAPVVVDVREPDEYVAGHVRGALNIPLVQLDERLAELPSDRTVVTYCNMHHRGTSRCEQAAALLREHGMQAQALDGGYPGWKEAGLPVEESAPVRQE
jgi:rhodanese-related sulfurtransferase